MGWRLAVSTTLIVTVIMGVVTIFQHRHELGREKIAREALLRESLAPLVYGLTTIEHEGQLKEEFMTFCHAFVRSGYSAHHMELRDAGGQTIISTLGKAPAAPGDFFRVSVPVVSPVLGGTRGTLILWEDASEYNKSVSRRWRSWALHMAVTLLPILLFLLLAIRFLVARPLEGLLDHVRKMEMGYWDRPPPARGPWEIRWLGWRFHNLGVELRKTVEELVQAEKFASQCSQPDGHVGNRRSSGNEIDTVTATLDAGSGIDCEALWQKCDDLMSMDMNDPATVELAREAWVRDARVAGQAGEMRLKAALEDAALRVLEPTVFPALEAELTELKTSLAAWAEQLTKNFRRLLDRERIPLVDINHRVKHAAGIWRKMKLKNLTLEEIDDVYAFRIIVPTEPDCYWALGKIHEAFRPVIGRFNDHIASPKPNGYQSIHTCVSDSTGFVFEIQIRSVAMHLDAERGSAAHWLYKEEQSVNAYSKPHRDRRFWRLTGRIRKGTERCLKHGARR